MFSKDKLKDALVEYKRVFISKLWEKEKFKWEAVKYFQDNWDINSSDFPAMLEQSLSKTSSVLTSMNHFPRAMITKFAKMNPEKVRAMFMELFDESMGVHERILAFKSQSDELLEAFPEEAKQHFQNENAVTTYLWLRFPDKYYIYKYGEVKKVSDKLHSDYLFKKGAYADNIRNSILFYNEISAELKQDEELVSLIRSQLTPDCYEDSELKTLTIDVGFYISRLFSSDELVVTEEWFPADYSPNISTEQWKTLLNDSSVFTTSSLEIMKRMKDYGGQATCKQLSVRYGELKNFYNTGSSTLARRVVKKTGCPVMERDTENSRWWPVLYVGKHATKEEEGSYIWKLRDELSAALEEIDFSHISLYAPTPPEQKEQGYWWLNANPKIWSLMNTAVGEEQSYTLYNENRNKRRVFQNFLDARTGDLVIGYESNPVKQVVALCKITEEQDGQRICFEKVEGFGVPIDYATLKNMPELSQMEYFVNPNGSFFKLTKGEFDFILDLIREENPTREIVPRNHYSKEDFLREVYMEEARYDSLVSVLKNKKNIILQGAPGVGKTFAAQKLAFSMMEQKDEERVEFIQFHQNYTYEDFMMGYKPTDNGFVLKHGVFYRFCQKAANYPDQDFFLIIDEINRGNLSKIFGELLMLIEKPYREKKITLAYHDIPFSVPANLYLIGLMNTADRSLAMMDYALRRRFSFVEMTPGFDSEGFSLYQKGLNSETFNELVDRIKELNKEIALDKSLGRGFCIGHSYFCGKTTCSDEWLMEVVEYDILPMLSEYWFDDNAKLQRWENLLRGVFQ